MTESDAGLQGLPEPPPEGVSAMAPGTFDDSCRIVELQAMRLPLIFVQQLHSVVNDDQVKIEIDVADRVAVKGGRLDDIQVVVGAAFEKVEPLSAEIDMNATTRGCPCALVVRDRRPFGNVADQALAIVFQQIAVVSAARRAVPFTGADRDRLHTNIWA